MCEPAGADGEEDNLMPTDRSLEQETIRAFLSCAGVEVARFEHADRPDARVTALIGGNEVGLDIEHTDYYLDRIPGQGGGSKGKRLHEWWAEVQDHLRETITAMESPPKVFPLVFLKPELLRGVRPEQFADELIQFAVDCERASTSGWVECFPSYRFLSQCVDKIHVQQTICLSFHWPCGNTSAGVVGVNLQRLTAIVQEKTQKSLGYAWRPGSQRWLLISASGNSIVNHAGPHPEFVNWSDAALQQACLESPFDVIVLWDRIRDWYVYIKPLG